MARADWPIERDPVFGCELWTGKLGSNGRPIVWLGRAPVNAYVIAYERLHGAVPADHVVDHVCRRVLCVNPAHLEAVTKPENERRKSMRYRLARRRCRRGHPLTEATRLTTPEMGVLCRTCAKEDP